VTCGEVRIGDSVRCRQRLYIVRGFTRASSSEQYVVLEEAETGETVTVLFAEVSPEDEHHLNVD
jgi:hypothetical protein